MKTKNYLPFSYRKRGFTLVELLVVIAIIGLLAAIVAVNFNLTKAKARDASRVGDARNIQTGLELYNNLNSRYVIAGDCDTNTWVDVDGATDAVSQALIALNLFPVGQSPHDPMSSSQMYNYCYSNSTSKYQFRYTLETNSNAGTQGQHIVSQ